MDVAVLIKQVPVPESLELGADGRLTRTGVELEMNAYCRRAVTTGARLAAETGGRSVVITLGPPSAEDVLREAVAWGADEGVLVSDPAFAGSDTIATARALAAVVTALGPFDLVLAGRNSIDADTGQVPPQVAELLDLPFAPGVRSIELDGPNVRVRSELDDGWRDVVVPLPAVLSTAERLCEPAKVPPAGRAAVPAERIRTLRAQDVGPGPWGEPASRTVVGPVRLLEVSRRGVVLEGPVEDQVAAAARFLAQWDVLAPAVEGHRPGGPAGPSADESDPVPERGPVDLRLPLVAVVVEPGRPRAARELLGEAAHLARRIHGLAVALAPADADLARFDTWGADRVVLTDGLAIEEDAAELVAGWCRREGPWAVLVPGTLWGREVAARVAVRLDAGLVGDAVGFGVDGGRLVSWKPAFGGQLVAAITATSPVQLATVRPGVLALRPPRRGSPGGPETAMLLPRPRGRIEVLDQGRDDEVAALVAARVVVAVGAGVDPADYHLLDPLLTELGAELGASRKVTDQGWLPRARQIGITGHSVAPALFVAIGVSGKFNHIVGARGAGIVVAVNNDPTAPIFASADLGVVADWRQAVPLLAGALAGSVQETSTG
jgi:electron transfer flavoprotein alpha subunit